jgi:hypothetical protein
MLDGEDGSRDVSSWFDSRLDVECAFEPSADGVVRCLPRTDATTALTGFSDERCSTPAASMNVKPTSCQQVDFVRAQLKNECPRRTHVFRGGPRLPAAFEDGGPAGCQPATDEYYGLGSELAAADFQPGAPRTWRAGGGHLAVQLLEAAGKIVRRRFVDQRFDLPCYVSTCKDDIRCVPPADTVEGKYYADPDCQHRLAGRKRGACLSPLVRFSPVGLASGVTYPCAEPIYTVGPLHQGPVYRRAYRVSKLPAVGSTVELDESRTTCFESTGPEDEELYQLGLKIDRSEFVELHFQTR